jgi:hypothetical protein
MMHDLLKLIQSAKKKVCICGTQRSINVNWLIYIPIPSKNRPKSPIKLQINVYDADFLCFEW